MLDVDRKVKAIVQVAGLHSLVRIDPQAAEKRDWFRKVSRLSKWRLVLTV